jgi:hypothetical protein
MSLVQAFTWPCMAVLPESLPFWATSGQQGPHVQREACPELSDTDISLSLWEQQDSRQQELSLRCYGWVLRAHVNIHMSAGNPEHCLYCKACPMQQQRSCCNCASFYHVLHAADSVLRLAMRLPPCCVGLLIPASQTRTQRTPLPAALPQTACRKTLRCRCRTEPAAAGSLQERTTASTASAHIGPPLPHSASGAWQLLQMIALCCLSGGQQQQRWPLSNSTPCCSHLGQMRVGCQVSCKHAASAQRLASA